MSVCIHDSNHKCRPDIINLRLIEALLQVRAAIIQGRHKGFCNAKLQRLTNPIIDDALRSVPEQDYPSQEPRT